MTPETAILWATAVGLWILVAGLGTAFIIAVVCLLTWLDG